MKPAALTSTESWRRFRAIGGYFRGLCGTRSLIIRLGRSTIFELVEPVGLAMGAPPKAANDSEVPR